MSAKKHLAMPIYSLIRDCNETQYKKFMLLFNIANHPYGKVFIMTVNHYRKGGGANMWG